MAGDKNPDISLRLPRYGIMMMVVEKMGRDWKVIAAQNTNASPGTALEREGLVCPITLPASAQ